MTALDVLRGARRILEGGGDPAPCRLGQWCPYCCAAIAKGDFDDRDGGGLDALAALGDVIEAGLTGRVNVRDSDAPLVEATRLIGEAGARAAGPFTRESALGFVDAAIRSAGP